MASTRVSWSTFPEELMVTMEDLRAALVDTGVPTKADAHAAEAGSEKNKEKGWRSSKKKNQHVHGRHEAHKFFTHLTQRQKQAVRGHRTGSSHFGLE